MAVAGAPWQLEFENVEERCGYLLTTGKWSDCTFMVGLETNQAALPAHKLVLAMASPVFENIFYGGLADRNELKISDVQPEAFKALLQYIYTGNTDINSLDMAWGLLHGAKKYMLPHLLSECYRYICSVLAPRNVCRAYEFAHLYDEKTIMNKCIEIISANTKDILNDSSFEDVNLNTLIKVCSLDYLYIDNELDLFHAVEKYAKAEQKRQGPISPVNATPPENLSELRVPPTAEEKVLQSSSQTRPAEETADKAKVKEEGRRPTIRAAIEKIRFLSLSAQEFAAGPARSGLLTRDETLAVLMNIASRDSAEPMPSGFSECRERRQPPSDLVEEGPFAKPRPEPSTESVGVAATKSLTPAEIVSGLLSHEQETLEQAARAARDMTKPSIGFRFTSTNDPLVEAGGIPPLVSALQHSSTGVQNEAASAIANIANNWSNIEALLTAGAVPVLVGLLGPGGAVAEQAARALGKIGKGYNTRDAVVNAGAPAALLAHMQPSTPSAPLETYLRTYKILCQNEFPHWSQLRFELLSPAVPYIEKLILLDDEQVLVEACSVLSLLVSGADMNPQLFTAPLVARLTALLRPAAAAPGVQSAALGSVVAMLKTPELEDICFGAGCLDSIINFLKCGNPLNVMPAAWAAVYILGSLRNRQPALDKGILDALVPALTEGDYECKSIAVRAIKNVCTHGSLAQLCVLAASAALEPYCRMMTDGSSARVEVLDGITSILKNVEENTKVELLLKLREIGVPQLLINIQKYGDKYYDRQRAVNLLQTYFKDDQL